MSTFLKLRRMPLLVISLISVVLVVLATIELVGNSERPIVAAPFVDPPSFRFRTDPSEEPLRASARLASRELGKLPLDPFDDGQAAYTLAHAQYRLGDMNGARSTLQLVEQRLDELRVGRPKAWWRLGHARVEIGDYKEARGALAKASVCNQSNQDPGRQLSLWRDIVADQYISGDRPSAAYSARQAEQVYANQPEGSSKLFALGQVATVRAAGRNLEGAFSAIQELLHNDSSMQLFAGLSLGEMAETVNIHDLGAAHVLLERVLKSISQMNEVDYRSQPLASLGLAWARLGDPVMAKRTAATIGLAGFGGETLALRRRRIEAFGQIAACFLDAGQLARARIVLAAVEPDLGSISMSHWSIAVEQIVIIGAQCGDIDLAERLVAGVEVGRRSRMLRQIAIAHARMGDSAGSIRLLGQAREEAEQLIARSPEFGKSRRMRLMLPNGKPLPSARDDANLELAVIAALEGDLAGAIERAAAFEDEDLRLTAYREIAAARVQIAVPAESLAWIRNLKEPIDTRAAIEGYAQGLVLIHSWTKGRDR